MPYKQGLRKLEKIWDHLNRANAELLEAFAMIEESSRFEEELGEHMKKISTSDIDDLKYKVTALIVEEVDRLNSK